MAYDVVFDSDLGTIRFENKDRYIYHTFHKPVSGPRFQSMMNAGLDHLAKQHAAKWLSDDRLNAQFAPEDIQFALADWGPRAAAAGWKFWALVVPKDMLGRDSMQAIVEAFFNMGVRVAIFSEVEPARDWLVSV
ncbi:MAG: hypothetical protein IPK19_41160 [Chloroflexi bacterium]|nr:hypothetical protein [Chloroflexota bacterium]